MKKIIRRIVNSFVFCFQQILLSMLNLYFLIFIKNYGFRSKSKIVVKYFLHAFKYKKNFSRKVFQKKRKTSIKTNELKKDKSIRLNLKRFVLFNLFNFTKKVFDNKKNSSVFYLVNKKKTKIIKKKINYVNLFFMNIKLNKKYFNKRKSYLLKKKFNKKINQNLTKKTILIKISKIIILLKILKKYDKGKINFLKLKYLSLRTNQLKRNIFSNIKKKIFKNLNLHKMKTKLLIMSKNFVKNKEKKNCIYLKKNNIIFLEKLNLNKLLVLKKKIRFLMLKKDLFLHTFRVSSIYQPKDILNWQKIILLLELQKISNRTTTRRFIFSEEKTKNKGNFFEFFFLKKASSKLVKYKYINKKRFYRQYEKKKLYYFHIKNNRKIYMQNLNFHFFMKKYFFYSKRYSLSKFNLSKIYSLKKKKSIQNLYIQRVFHYSNKNKNHLNFFLNQNKTKRNDFFRFLIKIYNFRLILNFNKRKLYKTNQKLLKKTIKIKTKNLYRFENFRKLINIKFKKYLLNSFFHKYIFVEKYIKIKLFNFFFYKYLNVNFVKLTKNLIINKNMINLMKTYVFKRIKEWSYFYYKTKSLSKLILLNNDVVSSKKKQFKKSDILKKKIKNKIIQRKKTNLFFSNLLKKIKIKKKKFLLNNNNVLKKNKKNTFKFFILRNKYLIIKLINKFMKIKKKSFYFSNFILKNKKTYKKKNINIFYVRKKNLYFFFKLYTLLKKEVFIFNYKINYVFIKNKRKVKEEFSIKKKNFLLKKTNLLKNFASNKKKFKIYFSLNPKNALYLAKKLKKYRILLLRKYFTKKIFFFNIIINNVRDVWLLKNSKKFNQLYKKYLLELKKRHIAREIVGKYNNHFSKKIKIFLYTKLKLKNKKINYYRRTKIQFLFFIKSKNKNQLKNFLNMIDSKLKNQTESKKEKIRKNKNYLLTLLYKRLITIKKKKNYILNLLLNKKKYFFFKSFMKKKRNLKKIFVLQYNYEKKKQRKIFQYFFNIKLIKKILLFVEYVFSKNYTTNKKKKQFLFKNSKKILSKLIKIQLFSNLLNFSILNRRYKNFFFKFYKKIYIKSYVKIKIYKQYKINQRLKKNFFFLKKNYKNQFMKKLYFYRNFLDIRRKRNNLITLNIKLKKNLKSKSLNINRSNNIGKFNFKLKGLYFNLKTKKLKKLYNIQKIDIKDNNSFYNLSNKKFNTNFQKNIFADIESSNPFILFRSFFFQKGSFFDSLFFNNKNEFENNFRKKFTFEFLNSYDNRYDRELPVDEFFFFNNSVQNKKIKGFFLAQPFTLPLLNILQNEKVYLNRKTITRGKVLNKIKKLDEKLLENDKILEKENNYDFILQQNKYETSNRKLLKSLLFSTVYKYLDYEENHHSLLSQKEFISYITLLYYDYENNYNNKLEVFPILGITSNKRGLDRDFSQNYMNRFKIKNSFQENYSSFIEEDCGITLDDKSIDNEELFSSFSNKDQPLDFYNDLDVFKSLGSMPVFNLQNKNDSKITYKLTNFFNLRKNKKKEEDFEERIKQYYSHKIIKGSILTDFDTYLIQKHLRKNKIHNYFKTYFYSFFFKFIFISYYSAMLVIIKYYKVYFKLKNFNYNILNSKISKKEEKLWLDFTNMIYLMLQESFLQKIKYTEIKENNIIYHKTVLNLLKNSTNFHLQLDKMKTLEMVIIQNFNISILQHDFDKKFFLEELFSMFNIEETDWFLMKESLFYKKSDKNFEKTTSQIPYIERSSDVMLEKNKYLLEIYKKKQKNKNFAKFNKIIVYRKNHIKDDNNTELEDFVELFSHNSYKKMKSYRFLKKDFLKKRFILRKQLDIRRKRRTSLLQQKSNIFYKNNEFLIKYLNKKRKLKINLFLNLLNFYYKKKNKSFLKRKIAKKIYLNQKKIKIYKNKNIKSSFLRKKNILKNLKNNQLFFFKKNSIPFSYQIKEEILKNNKEVFISDIVNIRLKKMTSKKNIRKKTKLNEENIQLLNYNKNIIFEKLSSLDEMLGNRFSDYQHQYGRILTILSHYRRKYRKYDFLKKIQNKIIYKIALNYYRKFFENRNSVNYKIKRSRNIKMYFKFVSAKLYRRRLFFYLLKKKKINLERRYYRLKIKNKWSIRNLYFDKDLVKLFFIRKQRKKQILFQKYLRKNKIQKNNNEKKINTFFQIKMIKILRSKYQSKFYDNFYARDDVLQKYLSTYYVDNDAASSSIFSKNSRSIYLLGFNSEILNYNLKNNNEDIFLEENLHKYSTLNKGFYLFSNIENRKRIKRMFFRNFYLKKVMLKKKILDYRQIDRNKYILSKMEKIKYRKHNLMKKKRKSILKALKKNNNLKYIFYRKYFKFSFFFLKKYFYDIIYKRHILKKNQYNVKFKIEKFKFYYNNIVCIKKNLKKKITTKKNIVEFLHKKKIEKIVCFFLYKKKFFNFFKNNFEKKILTKLNDIITLQKRKTNDRFFNFYLNKERRFSRKIFKKLPYKIINKKQNTQSRYYNIEISYYKKIASIIKRNIIIKNQHNYSWNALTQESRSVNYLIKTRSLNYNVNYQMLFMNNNQEEIFTSKNFFNFKIPFVKKQEQFVIKKILSKVDNFYYNFWEKINKNKTIKFQKEELTNKTNIIKTELLFLQWFMRLNYSIKMLSEYLVHSLCLFLFFFGFFILDLKFFFSLVFSLTFFTVFFPSYFSLFHFLFRIIKLGNKVYFLRYLQKEKIFCSKKFFSFDTNKKKNISVLVFLSAMSFLHCKKKYSRFFFLLLLQIGLYKFYFLFSFYFFMQFYVLILFLVVFFFFVFNIKHVDGILARILKSIFRIFFFEIPWFFFFWIFTLLAFLLDVKKNALPHTRIFQRIKPIELILFKMFFIYIQFKCFLEKRSKRKKAEIDFEFLEEFFDVKNMKKEKQIYLKYKKYLKKNQFE